METNQEKGYNYEIQIRDYIINKLNKPAYLWSDTPETILINCGIIGSHNQHRLTRINIKENSLQDTGIDIIQVDSNTESSLVQCKNGYKTGLTINDLAGFMCWMAAMNKINGYVYYTNKLSEIIKCLPKTPRIEYIKQPYIKDNKKENNNISRIKPFDYQIKAKDEFIKYFQDNQRGILSMPCGTGKTFTSYLISQSYKQIIIISPLKQFAKQNLDRYIEYGYQYKTLLVDSDGERDINEIKKFITEDTNFLISATFCSVDVISKLLELFSDPLFIIDEFHNLSKANVIDKNDDFNKILSSDKKILFMSATPRVYEMEDLEEDLSNQNDLIEDEETEINENEIDIFGEIVYNMTFTEAIEKKYITDYQIWLPSIHEDNETLNKELNIYQIDSVIKSKCTYLFSCLLNNGSKKCIIYCQDTKEISLMREAISKLNEYFYLDYEINQITSVDSAKSRTDILDKFATSNKIQLLFSVRILDECIDIPSCDSIYVTYPTKSKIRTIQRLSRCIRIDKMNPFKIGNIYIWCDEYDQILDTLSGIKEYDLFFKDKIKINETNFFGDSKKEGITVDVKLVEKFVMGIKEFKITSWDEKLEWVKKYIDENKIRPSYNDDKILCNWLGIQIKNYNKNILKNNRKKLWIDFINNPKYKNYFLSNEEQWNKKIELVIKYIDINKKRPSQTDSDFNIKKLGQWFTDQIYNYKNKKQIMNNINIYNKFDIFYKKNIKLLDSNDNKWYENLKQLIEFIEKYKKRPTSKTNKKLEKWLSHQITNYNNKKDIMNNIIIRNEWEKFYNKYKNLLKSKEEQWVDYLNFTMKYIDENDKKPSNIKFYANWISNQIKNYENNEQIMRINKYKKLWENFYEKYKEYFKSPEEIWFDKLNQVILYIKDNNKRPTDRGDDNNSILGRWINTQSTNYNKKERSMKNSIIKKKWEEFINDPKYKEYF
jgi:superfamily II DNA or RNA helicase